MAKVNKKQMIMLSVILVCIMIVLSLLMGKFAYSYLGADIDPDAVTEGEVSASGDTLVFTKGNALSLNASTDNFSTGDGNLVATTQPKAKLVASAKTNNASAKYNVGFRINKNTYQYSTTEKTGEILLTIKNPSNTVISSITGLNYVTVNGVSGFDITGKEGTFTAANNYTISTTSSSSGTTQTWTFTLTFVNFETDQSINETAEIQIDVVLQKDAIQYHTYCDETLFACKIAKTVDTDATLYLHDSTLANGVEDDNYRFSGANYVLTSKASAYSNVADTSSTANGVIKMYCSRGDSYSYVGSTSCNSTSYTRYYYLAYDTNKTQYSDFTAAAEKAVTDGYLKSNVNNYVCFGSDATTCPVNNLYRIIGVFGNQVKLIKADAGVTDQIGTNGDYNRLYGFQATYIGRLDLLTEVGKYDWNGINYDLTYERTNMANIWSYSALNKNNLNENYISYLNSQNAKWANMISSTVWNIGGLTTEQGRYSKAKTVYDYELGDQSINDFYNAKVGLMYLSDYMYATDTNYWTYHGYTTTSYPDENGNSGADYDFRAARYYSWIYLGLGEHTISRITDRDEDTFYIAPSGIISPTYSAFAVRPTFNLLSTIKYASGNGTLSSPYRIKA